LPSIHLPEPPLGDDELTLRAFTLADAGSVTEACQDPEIPRWTAVPSPYGEPDARRWITAHDRRRTAGEAIELAVVAPEGALLACVGIDPVDWANRRGELGYWVARPARRRGVATRAVRILSRWGLESLGLERLELLAHPGNVASQRVAERAGFTREGLLRSYREIKGERVDLVMFSLIPGDPAA
jgi:ribosomal-protein-alanine N-acetyltransferase